MTDKIIAKLNQLAELDAHREIIRLDKQNAIDTILTDEVKAQLSAIDVEFDPLTEAVNDTAKIIEADIKVGVLAHGTTVKGAYTAIYRKGRVTWSTKALEGYATAHPEIEQFKKIGNPSVSIRRK